MHFDFVHSRLVCFAAARCHSTLPRGPEGGEALRDIPETAAKETKARFKGRTLHVPNLMQMRKMYCFRSFALDSAHVKFDVWNGPNSRLNHDLG